ncbi:MAG: exosortase A [Burkholderiales bacterium]
MPRDITQLGAGRWPLHAAATVLLLLWIGFCYRDAAASMVQIWSRSDTFAHGFFIAPISLWLIWRQRERLAAATPVVSPIWALPLLLLGVTWWIGYVTAANVVVQFSFVGMLIAGVFLTLGWSVARLILFPLMFLLFAVPFGEFLLPLLIEKTADFTIWALRLTGVPVYREGNNFQIPSGAWSVVEACSGVRYLIASITVGALFAYLNYRSWKRRLVFVAVSIAVPVIANWVRAYMIVMLGHLSDNRIATGVDHLVYGWVFFGIVISIMFVIGARWTEPALPHGAESSAVAKAAAPRTTGLTLRWIGLALVAGWLALPPAASRLVTDDGAVASARTTPSAQVTLPSGRWQALPEPATATNSPPDAGRASSDLIVYQNDHWWVGLSLTDATIELAAWPTVDVPSSTSALHAAEAPHAINADLRCGGQPVNAVAARSNTQTAAGDTANPLMIWRVQWNDGFVDGSDRWLRLHRAVARLRGKVNDTAAVSLVVPQSQSPTALKMFFEESCVAIDTYLRHRRDARRKDVTASRHVGQ